MFILLNNTIEKNNIPYKFFDKKVKNNLRNNMKYLNKDFNFYTARERLQQLKEKKLEDNVFFLDNRYKQTKS